ncbi:MAG TPA: protein kinase [Gemmatimonadales bacterium]|nr:protein kinase [Gemmatimonadales bacterium]
MTDPLPRLATALADRYRLERELGAGGMATVYLAEDLKHDRQVAIKVLRPELAAVIGADRFLSEIKTTANLQHPHILPLHDSGECDGFLYYVMPLIEGETVRDRITREKQLPIADAVRIARECALALDYAHRKGIVHRDIKPENILLHDGSALVADFGIALAASQAGDRMTQTGMSLGTPHYMSPEQAMGEREITARSDVYALGCVLYEMLTGEPPFTGTTAQAIVARVVTESPRPMLTQRHTIPPHVEAAVLTALEKLPADRFATAAEFAEALSSTAFTRPMTAFVPTASPASHRWRRVALATGAVAALAVAAALWGWLRPEPPRPVSRYGLAFAEGQAPVGRIAITPDGSRLVYQGPGDSAQQRQLWVKRRDEYQATPLPGTTNPSGQIISPDGEWIAFGQGSQLKKIPISGGAITTLTDSANGGAAMAWLDDGTIVYVQRNSWNLMRVSETGGPSTLVRAPEAPGRVLLFPSALPRGRGVLFTSCSQSCTTGDLWVLDLASGDARVLLPGERQGAYLSSGHVAYVARDGQVFAAPFDLKTLAFRSTPVPVLGGVATGPNGLARNLTASSTGTLVLEVGGPTAGGSGQRHTLVWVDRTGTQRPVDSAWTFRLSRAGGNVGWSLSPDGTQLAVGLNNDAGDDIWIKELPAGPLSRVTFDSANEARPRWTRDGRSVTYLSQGGELRQRRADGTGGTENPLAPADRVKDPIREARWSPDGRWLVIRTGGAAASQAGGRDILGLRPGIDSAPVPLVAQPDVDESAPALSPDGRWLAYESDETGRSEIYVRPFPATDSGKWQVSTNGGQAPLWAHSGRELFYVDAERNMVAAPVQGGAEFRLGARRALFNLGEDLYLVSGEYYTPFDLSRDDQRFLMARALRRAESTRSFLLVENWFEELKAKVKP